MLDIVETGVARLSCSCTTGPNASRLVGRGVTGMVGNGVTGVISPFTADLVFLKRRGGGVVGIEGGVTGRDASSMSSLGVLKRVEEAGIGIDVFSIAGLGLLIDTIEGGVEPRRNGSSEVIRRAMGKRCVGDATPSWKLISPADQLRRPWTTAATSWVANAESRSRLTSPSSVSVSAISSAL